MFQFVLTLLAWLKTNQILILLTLHFVPTQPLSLDIGDVCVGPMWTYPLELKMLIKFSFPKICVKVNRLKS